MKLVTLSGGLGNQMFQYAFYLALKVSDRNVFVYKNKILNYAEHNGYELDRLFGIEKRCENLWVTDLFAIKGLGNVFKHIVFPVKVRERVLHDFSVYGSWLKYVPFYGVHLVGYWQSERYFEQVKDVVRKTFIFDERKVSGQTKACLDKLSVENSVSIHVRRGDYLLAINMQTLGNICDIFYYRKAISFIGEKVNNPTFYIFSDDIKWAKENLLLPDNAVFVDWNTGKGSWQDMFLMSKCKHNIIANSSFSWWGAWLNNYENKIVLAPDRWLHSVPAPDIIPESWIKI